MTPTPISGLFEALALLGVATLVGVAQRAIPRSSTPPPPNPSDSEDAHAALERKKKMIRMMMLIVVLAIWAMMMVKIQSVASHSVLLEFNICFGIILYFFFTIFSL
uniref:Uncharacterized protein n=1 Tax=Ananas comosus var. bracteatus TaxID=296719 RepID=A0A6V7PG68_ANACO|nr:unnamed protein product [Ananas comosus var. bracteatus]